MMTRAVFATLLLAGALAPTAAHAYRTTADHPDFDGVERVVWTSATVAYELNVDGVPGVPFATIEARVRAGVSVWSAPECTDIGATYLGPSSSAPRAGDTRNTVGWMRGDWARLGFPRDAAGATDVVYVRADGGTWHVEEADIYLNAQNFSWAPSAGDPDTIIRSVQAVIAHEFGHVLSMEHPCSLGDDESTPACAGAAPTDAPTMYPQYLGPSQAILSADDEAGICYLYPRRTCSADSCDPGQACVDSHCVDACGARVCQSTQTCIEDVCVRQSCAGERCSDPCGDTLECPAGMLCSSGTCVATGQLGDPCAHVSDCFVGLCGETGYCTLPCGAGCPEGYSCATSVGHDCLATRGVVGDACSVGEECVSRLCLIDGEGGVCTRSCATNACASSYECADVSGEEVCRPAATSSAGCSATGRSRGAFGFFTVLFGLLLIWRQR